MTPATGTPTMIRVQWTFPDLSKEDGVKDFPANSAVQDIVEHISSTWEDGRCDINYLHVRIY